MEQKKKTILPKAMQKKISGSQIIDLKNMVR